MGKKTFRAGEAAHPLDRRKFLSAAAGALAGLGAPWAAAPEESQSGVSAAPHAGSAPGPAPGPATNSAPDPARGPLPGPAPSGASELAAMTVLEAAQGLRARRFSSLELTEACLNRIAALDPRFHAYITVLREPAIAQAKLLDQQARAGGFRGPLHGIPLALKDNIDTAGTRTTAASETFDDRVPGQDAFVAARLREAGAVLLGKTNLHEFALGHTSATSYFGPVRNPWDPERTPGGSSGGSAAAVVADMCLAAVGTDTGGSVRMPAAYCGVVGLKPTYGLVSIRGIIPLAYSLDHCGPITKTTADAAVLLHAMAGYDKYDIASVDRPLEDYAPAMKVPVKTLRVGVPRAPFFDRLDPEIASAVEAALELIGGLVASVKDVSMPSSSGVSMSLLTGELLAYHQQLLRRDGGMGYSISIRRLLEASARNLNDGGAEPCSERVVDYIQSSWELQRMRRTIDDAFSDFDLLVLPTMRILQPEISAVLARDETATPKALEPERDNNCQPFNVWGIPAISIPCGFSKKGLPIGLMIAGPRFREGRILALAHAYEQATEWHTRRPPLTLNGSQPGPA